jgi:hypothetical protein
MMKGQVYPNFFRDFPKQSGWGPLIGSFSSLPGKVWSAKFTAKKMLTF